MTLLTIDVINKNINSVNKCIIFITNALLVRSTRPESWSRSTPNCRLAVLGHEVGDTRLSGVCPIPVWMRSASRRSSRPSHCPANTGQSHRAGDAVLDQIGPHVIGDDPAAGQIQSVAATPRLWRWIMGRPKGWMATQLGREPMRSPGRPPGWRREHRQEFWDLVGQVAACEMSARTRFQEDSCHSLSVRRSRSCDHKTPEFDR